MRVCSSTVPYRWAESELLDTLTRLEIGLAGRVESWKTTRWAAKLEQLKTKNDSLVSLCCNCAMHRYPCTLPLLAVWWSGH